MKLVKYREFKSSIIFSIFFLFTPEILVCIIDNSCKTSGYCSGKELYNVGGESSFYIGFTAVLL